MGSLSVMCIGKAVAWVSTFSRHLNSSEFSDVSFEWRREERRDGEEKRCTDIPSHVVRGFKWLSLLR